MAANGFPKVRFGVAWLRRRISERVVLICTCCRDLGGFLPAFFAARHPVGCFCPRPRWSYRARHENTCFPSTRVDDTSPVDSGNLFIGIQVGVGIPVGGVFGGMKINSRRGRNSSRGVVFWIPKINSRRGRNSSRGEVTGDLKVNSRRGAYFSENASELSFQLYSKVASFFRHNLPCF